MFARRLFAASSALAVGVTSAAVYHNSARYGASTTIVHADSASSSINTVAPSSSSLPRIPASHHRRSSSIHQHPSLTLKQQNDEAKRAYADQDVAMASAHAAISSHSPSSASCADAACSGIRQSPSSAPMMYLSTVETSANIAPQHAPEDVINPMTPAQCVQCDEWKSRSINQSRKVNYMLRAIERVGCSFDPFTFIRCIPCGPTVGGGLVRYVDDRVDLIMCGNGGIKSFAHYEIVLTHELIHMYDHCRANINLADLNHHACTEVRAANLSGDCSFVNEFRQIGNTHITNHQPICVKRKAIKSILSNPYCESVQHAKDSVDAVYDRCATDTEPFGSIPW